MNQEQAKTANGIVGVVCLVGVALIGWTMVSAKPTHGLQVVVDGTQGTNGTDAVERRAQPDAEGWMPAAENIRDGVKIYDRTYDGKMHYWVKIASAKTTMRDVGDNRPQPCVLVEFPNGTIEWKTVDLVGSARHFVHASDPALK
jgi:hypothetical protein